MDGIKFELYNYDGKTVAVVSADNIEAILQEDEYMTLFTRDGFNYDFNNMELIHDE